MKRFFLTFIVFLLTITSAIAQDYTKSLTLYREFKPATVYLSSGKKTKVSLANIFLKNAALLYNRGENTMEAYMSSIDSVTIEGKTYVTIENKMAQFIDSIKGNRLYGVTLIDLEAYQAMLKNNVNITANSFQDLVGNSEQLSFSTIELESKDEHSLPIIRQYYYLYNGEYVRVHEREISRKLPKDKKHAYKTILALPDFSWTNPDSLMKLLKVISD